MGGLKDDDAISLAQSRRLLQAELKRTASERDQLQQELREERADHDLAQKSLTAALGRVDQLQQELEREWIRNHDDTCDNLHRCDSFVDGGVKCHWPRPRALSSSPDTEETGE